MKKIKQITAVLLCVLTLFSVLSVSAFAAVKPTKPTSLTASNINANSVTLTWKAGKNATGYRIYYKLDGKWNTHKDVTGTSYTVTGLRAANTYVFAVKSLRKESGKVVLSDAYPTVKVTTKALVATKLTATAAVNSITLNWNTVAGAQGYIIYQYISGKWKVIGTPASGKKSGVVKNLKHNTSYRFVIRPYTLLKGKVALGPASNYLTVKTLDRNKITVANGGVNASAVKLKWSKAPDATGYGIYSYVNGAWKVVKTIHSRDTLTYTVPNLTSDKKYQFRMRAFKKVGASVKWYEWSNTVTAITNPSSKDLKVTRTAKLKDTFEADSFTFSYKITDKKYGNVPVTIAKKGDSYYLSSKVNELEYTLLNNAEGFYIILNERKTYVSVPELLSGAFDIRASVNELLPGVGWSSKATIETFNGKKTVCETFVNPLRTVTVKYYYKTGVLVGINEYGINSTLVESATVTAIKNSSTASLFSVPAGYSNILYPDVAPEIGKTLTDLI